MSDTDPISDVEEDEMAAFMGFSTFGKAPAAKKRKFNPQTDSFVEGEDLAKIDRGGKKGKGSGGNEVPLGRSRVIGSSSGSGGKMDGVRDLGMGIGGMNLPAPRATGQLVDQEERGAEVKFPPQRRGRVSVSPPPEEGDENGPRYMNTSLPPPRTTLRASPPRDQEDDEGPRYMDTSLPPPTAGPAYMDTSLPPPIAAALQDIDTASVNAIDDAEAREMQERIDRIMASIQPEPKVAAPGTEDASLTTTIPFMPPPPPLSYGIPSKPEFSSEQRGNGLPARPDFNAGGGRGGGVKRGRGMSDAGSFASSGGRQRGERNDEWYVGYYDPAFNENPWARLEVERGLESVGSWVERPKREVR